MNEEIFKKIVEQEVGAPGVWLPIGERGRQELFAIAKACYEYGKQARRERLPDDRPPGVTHKVRIGEEKIYITTNGYLDGRLGEVFLRVGVRANATTLSGFADALSIMISLALQYGVPLNHICDKLEHMRFEPQGSTGSEFGFAKSIVDYVARWLRARYCKETK